MVLENGLYVCKYDSDFFVIRIEGLDENTTYKEYDNLLNDYIIGQPISGKLPPLQDIPLIACLDDIKKVDLPNGFDDNMWMTWRFDWNKLYLRWYNNKCEHAYQYVRTFKEEVRKQYNSRLDE